MKDEIIIIVKRDGEYHKLILDKNLSCNNCSLCDHTEINGIDVCGTCDACDICMAVDGCFKKVVTK